MRTITEEQYWFFQFARTYFEHEGSKTAGGHKRAARRMWAKMVHSEADKRREIERQDKVA